MTSRGAAAAAAIMSVIIAIGAGFGVASATEHPPPPPSGGTCNNYGNGAVIVAPFCGANFAPSSVTPTTTTPPPFQQIPTRPPLICLFDPTAPECTPRGGLEPAP